MLVSIVVPAYNQGAYLPITLDSVWFQDYADLEIIVVDDGSTDNTAQVIDDYLAAVAGEKTSYAANLDETTGEVQRIYHPRYPAEGRSLTILRHEKNRGLSAALNTGFRAASGELCTFIASDDLLLPAMVSELAGLLARTGADFAYADQHIVDDAGRILRRFRLPDYTFEAAFCHWYLCGVGKLYKRCLHERYGYFREDLTVQDHEMYLRFAMNGAKFAHCPKVLVNLRVHDRDRAVDNHTPDNMARLYRESSELVRIARRHKLDGQD
ncbi:MAG: glycosyltransferase [Desulfovibrionaceae bacterium]|nr:glycosyltransferase [Desulfovibrionaceae bacterium]MBF0513827.1 glycosyltransferase [Desulfovibrionaceae bacterium]